MQNYESIKDIDFIVKVYFWDKRNGFEKTLPTRIIQKI